MHYTDDASTVPKGVKAETTGGAELMEIKQLGWLARDGGPVRNGRVRAARVK